MNTPCPNCSSNAALGTEAVSACTDCASITIAGASISVPGLLVATLAVVSIAVLARSVASALRGTTTTA